MSVADPEQARDPHQRAPANARALFRDAWVFFTLLVLLVAVFVVLWPLQAVDRVAGTRLVARLIGVIERVGDL